MSTLLVLQSRMFLIMFLGMLLRKKDIITAQGQQVLTDLVLFLILPCNIICSFLIEFDSEILQNFLTIFIISVAIQFGCFVLGKVLYTKVDDGKRKILQYATSVSNAGFLGSPVAEGVFGSMGLVYSSIYLIPMRVIMWSAGISLFTASVDCKSLVKKVLTHPCIIAVFAGLALMFAQVSVPQIILAPLQDLSACNTGVSMLVIGSILADLNFRTLFDKTVLLFSALRLVGIPLVVYALCLLCGVDGLVMGVAVLMVAMPAASATALLAAKYKKDAAFASKCVIATTLLSVVSIPLWSTLLLQGI
ncbi:MAG: AEC family transporter [Faecalibacterium sp.]